VSQQQTRMVVIENYGSCNMRCTYCFPEHMWTRHGHKGVMSEATYRGALETVLGAPSEDSVDVHLAGGEPLLAGRDWLDRAFTIGREIAARHGKSVTFSLQTNATMVTPELARFLVDNGVTVGVSLDGDRTINEAVRGHTDRTLAGFRHLTEAMGHPPGVIVTVTRCNALRMHEVIDYLESLGVALFRANQMGATASWNEHSAPRAEEWAAARQAILEAIAARGGRIMEFNLSQLVPKLVRSLLEGVSPFDGHSGCCDMRCPAGSELVYFDHDGEAYPCPRANVTPDARIGHYADPDFDVRWNGVIHRLDAAMAVPDACARCPAQLVCDYGCHAFNHAEGNFFEVNCDASKDYFRWIEGHLEEVARVFLLMQWRAHQKALGDRAAVTAGTEVPDKLVRGLADRLDARLAEHLASPALDVAALDERYGWRTELVPQLEVKRPRVSAVAARGEGGEG
jgi:uncharacterized protein